MKGIRVQNVIQELRGEKIDIIPWSDNPVYFVRSALSPAEISSVRIDERSKAMEIMVEDDQLSLAIGRRGQNVRLASQLTGWKLDIISKSKLQRRTSDSIFNLQHIEGVTETMAHSLYGAGFLSMKQVAEAAAEALQRVPGYEAAEAAEKLKERAAAAYEKHGDLVAAAPETVATEGASKDAKSQAEQRLRELVREQDKTASSDQE